MPHRSKNPDCRWALVVHGGAEPVPVSYTTEEDRRRHDAFEEAMQVGKSILAAGGRSLDAVQAAVRVLEDAQDYNAARGAALTHEGHAELDASLMDGRDRRVGAVAGLRCIRNPIDLARCILDRSHHVFLMGDGAEAFAELHKIEKADPAYFVTERQTRELRQAIEREQAHIPAGAQSSGTVGAVALDQSGNLAAATSTGGLPNKRFGRVGDSPLIGAGTYAENGVCAVAATGWGEFFVRTAAAYDVCARIKYGRNSVQTAAKRAIEAISQLGGCGGVIALDAQGRFAMPYSTATMARGYASSRQPTKIVL